MKTTDNYDFSGKKALVRVDFNVPLKKSFKVVDETRIKAAIPTINKILSDGGSAILMSHLGRPKGVAHERFSLKHIVSHLSELLQREVKFADDCLGKSANNMVANMQQGDVVLLENLRFYNDETEASESFAEKLSHYADVYVNDAFSISHRAHASMVAITKFFPDNKVIGLHIVDELKCIDRVMNKTESPYTAIIGGMKVSGKIDIINQLLKKTDNLIIGGGMAFTFIRAMGGKTGGSFVEKDRIDVAKDVIEKAKEKNVNLFLPTDAIVANDFSNDALTKCCNSDEIKRGWMGLDIGQETILQYCKVIAASKTILWNGPMGVFEYSNFEKGTRTVAEAIADVTQNGAFSLLGGGDSVSAINKFGLSDKVSHVSTGGGALLDYIGGKELPGLKAIMD